jgi:hypothetical protein
VTRVAPPLLYVSSPAWAGPSAAPAPPVTGMIWAGPGTSCQLVATSPIAYMLYTMYYILYNTRPMTHLHFYGLLLLAASCCSCSCGGLLPAAPASGHDRPTGDRASFVRNVRSAYQVSGMSWAPSRGLTLWLRGLRGG